MKSPFSKWNPFQQIETYPSDYRSGSILLFSGDMIKHFVDEITTKSLLWSFLIPVIEERRKPKTFGISRKFFQTFLILDTFSISDKKATDGYFLMLYNWGIQIVKRKSTTILASLLIS